MNFTFEKKTAYNNLGVFKFAINKTSENEILHDKISRFA